MAVNMSHDNQVNGSLKLDEINAIFENYDTYFLKHDAQPDSPPSFFIQQIWTGLWLDFIENLFIIFGQQKKRDSKVPQHFGSTMFVKNRVLEPTVSTSQLKGGWSSSLLWSFAGAAIPVITELLICSPVLFEKPQSRLCCNRTQDFSTSSSNPHSHFRPLAIRLPLLEQHLNSSIVFFLDLARCSSISSTIATLD